MMSFRQPYELPEIPIAGRQVGDTDLMTADGVIHLPNCSIFGDGYTKEDKPVCSCGARFAHPSEFTQIKVGD